MFYAQLLRAQIPKLQKDAYDIPVFFLALLGSAHVKAANKMLL